MIERSTAPTRTLACEKRENKIVCSVCPHACVLTDGQRGICRARVSRDNTVINENYGRITSLALDPIEKKPLAHFMPGSTILSVGSYGCNMRCCFCQNASIAQCGSSETSWQFIEPEAVADMALSFAERGNIGVAFTYNEPLVGYEFVRDCGKAVHERGQANVLVSNGQVNEEPLNELLPIIDAANIDLKAFSEDAYLKLGGDLGTTMNTIETFAADPSTHLEVTMLLVPGLNDSLDELRSAAQWLASLDRAIPLHITRFFPCYKMLNAEPTPVETVYSAVEEARKFLDHVYPGNC